MENSSLRRSQVNLKNFLRNKLDNALASRMALEVYYIKKKVTNI